MGILVAEGLIALGVLVGAGLGLAAVGKGAAATVRRWSEKKRLRDEKEQPWTVHTRSAGKDRVVVEVIHANEDPQEMEVLDTGDFDFDIKLFEAQSRARNVARALNSNSN